MLTIQSLFLRRNRFNGINKYLDITYTMNSWKWHPLLRLYIYIYSRIREEKIYLPCSKILPYFCGNIVDWKRAEFDFRIKSSIRRIHQWFPHFPIAPKAATKNEDFLSYWTNFFLDTNINNKTELVINIRHIYQDIIADILNDNKTIINA